ncbi:MAG: phosphodiester glycosidase family protein [Muribaculaceae bacterium]|nr:phosphodiester glycosidase family protein [Muribaculaceae bacterium]
MKKQVAILALACAAAFGAQASTQYNVRGTVYQTDTLFHAMLGPGTSQTSLLMRSEAGRQMYVYYAKIDLTNPYISFSTVMGKDQLAGTETVRSMSERKSRPGARYFLGVNGDFFYTSGNTSRGESKIGIPIGPCIVDGEIYKANTNSSYTQFVLDANNQNPIIGSTKFSGSVTNAAGTKISVGGVNLLNPSLSNRVIIYNSHFFSGTDLPSGDAEIAMRLADGESFVFGKPFKMVATGAPSTAGDMNIPADGFVIHGQGTGNDFVKALKEGDEITVEFHAKIDGKEIYPHTMMSSWPNSLHNGEVTETEYLLEEFGTNQPVTAVAIADGGKTIMFLTIDGRSPLSSGARTTEIADLLRLLGATDAVNMDSGGSSTFYSSSLGVRNVPSDGSERPDGNGIFAVYTAPDDSTIASIAFVDWVAKVPKYGIYRPKFYGYNKYGLLIDTDLHGVTISCPESVGHVQQDSVFFGDGAGDGLITAHYGDMTATVPVQIFGEGEGIKFKNDSIVNDTYRDYVVEVTNTVGDITMPIHSSVLTWSSSDESVVKIDAETGALRGVTDGEAYVYGTIGEFTDTMKVIVERPTAHVMPMDPGLDVSTWKISQTGGKNAVSTAHGDGFTYTYTGASGRSPKIVLTKTIRLWSLPDAIRIRFNPGEAPVSNVVLGLRPNGQKMSYQTLTPDTVIAGKMIQLELPTSSWIDADDMMNYPIVLSTIQLNMGTSTTGKEYTIDFDGFELVYDAVVDEKKGDVDGNGEVNVSDVTALINKILSLADFSDTVCDINADGVVNVSDVTALINIILGL